MRTNSPFPTLVRALVGYFSKAPAVLLVLVAMLSLPASGQKANISLSPANSAASVGQTFTVTVKVNVTEGNINGAKATLFFNNSVLEVTDIVKSGASVLPLGGPYTVEPADYPDINEDGYVRYAAGTVVNYPSTSFDFLTITFRAKAMPAGGTTTLSFGAVPPFETLVSRNGTSAGIYTGSTNGTVTITTNCPTPPAVTLSAGSGSSTCNGKPTPLTLSAASGVGPFTLDINGVTYTNVAVGTSFADIPFPTYKIWPSNPTPANTTNNDGQPIEVGVKFRASQPGFIKGIRFYNGNNTSGTYTGKIWNYSTGTIMASAVFSSVSANGWQEVLFSSPIPVAPNTTYIASYHSTAGNYAVNDNYFSSSVTSGPLTALANNGISGANGVYRYGSGVTMPSSTYAASNYWVDVIFASNTNTINLTRVVDANGCEVTGSLQTINSFSGTCSSLPITLVNLSATPGNRKVTLHWTTAQELNNKGFDVMRSTDGAQWTHVGFVAGAGNSNAFRSYTFDDINLEPRKYFYRLKQIDIDDNFTYTGIVSATLGVKPEFVLGQSYPNPTKGQTTVQFTLPHTEDVNISLFDVSGRLMKVLVNGKKDAGTHSVNFNVGLLTKGVYYYKMQAGEFSDVKKLVIQ